MKAMILAAGEGRRMRPLTLTLPKPLLKVGNDTLIGHHLHRIRAAGITEIVINVSYLGAQIQHALGDGSAYGVHIHYSVETEPLETGGALHHALPLLGEEPFLLVNGDVWTDMPIQQLITAELPYQGAHLVLVGNPEHHGGGDFVLTSGGQLRWSSTKAPGEACFTYAGLGVFHPDMIRLYPNKREKFPLREVFDWAISKRILTGEFYAGEWLDVGTPERLASLATKLCR